MLVFFFILILSSTCFSQLSESDSLLIKTIIHNYETCQSYQDSGIVEKTILYLEDGSIENHDGNFTTSFLRKKGYRFFHTIYQPRIATNTDVIIHNNADSSFSTFLYKRNVRPSEIKKTSLMLCIARATGITNGLAFQVPRFLMGKELEIKDFLKSDSLVRLKDISSNGNDFYQFKITRISKRKKIDLSDKIKNYPELKKEQEKLQNIPKSKSVKIFWFNKKSLLLEKIRYTIHFPKSKTEIIFTFFPKINQEIEIYLLEENFPE